MKSLDLLRPLRQYNVVKNLNSKWINKLTLDERLEGIHKMKNVNSVADVDFLFMWLCVWHVHGWYPQGQEGGCRFLETGITGTCEPLCGCWGSNLGPSKEQQVLFATEPSLQPRPLLSDFILGLDFVLCLQAQL